MSLKRNKTKQKAGVDREIQHQENSETLIHFNTLFYIFLRPCSRHMLTIHTMHAHTHTQTCMHACAHAHTSY